MGRPNRWVMLGLGMAAQGASSMYMLGLPFLVPAFRSEQGLSLAQTGLILGAPSLGMLFTLIAWGWIADRYGERLALTGGLALGTGFLAAAALAGNPVLLAVLLALAGAAGGSTNAASGRVVLGWFPPERRGVAMGLRQTALPLGVAVAGVVVPPLGSVRAALLVMAGICLVATIAVGLFVVNPPRPASAGGGGAASPYRISAHDGRAAALWRVHGASMLLVVPQMATAAFALTYLVSVRHWEATAAGHIIAVAQLAGAAGRLLCGRWSDRVGARLRPMRQLAVVNGVVMLLLAAAVQAGSGAGTPLLVAALAMSMSGNGLAFTAVSELAGTGWAGRALGVQNTVQNLTGAVTPALVGVLIAGPGYGTAFALAGFFAVAAAFVTPASAEAALGAAPAASADPRVPGAVRPSEAGR